MKLENDFEVSLKLLGLSSSCESAKECPFTFLRMACGIFDEENKSPSVQIFTTTQHCLTLMADFCNHKELILALAEELCRESDYVPLQKVNCMLPVFAKCVEALKQQKFVTLALNAMCAFLEKTIPLSKEPGKTNKLEKELTHTLGLLIDSMTPFFEENFSSLETKESEQLRKQNLSILLLRLMSYPLSFLSSLPATADDYNQSCQYKCLKLFSSLQNDLLKFQHSLLQQEEHREAQRKQHLRMQRLKRANKIPISQLGAGECGMQSRDDSEDDDNDDDDAPEAPLPWEVRSGLLVLSDLVFRDKTFVAGLLPCVYSHEHLFKEHLRLIHSCLHSHCFSTKKAISLISSLLRRLGFGHLTRDLLDFEAFKPVLEVLLAEITTPSSKLSGRRSLDCLNLLTWSFTPPARVDLLSYLLLRSDHSGFLGFLITTVKSQLDESLNNQDGVFDRDVITKFSRYIFNLDLPREVKVMRGGLERGSIHQHLDRYMASLNFLRFLIIRCGREGGSGSGGCGGSGGSSGGGLTSVEEESGLSGGKEKDGVEDGGGSKMVANGGLGGKKGGWRMEEMLMEVERKFLNPLRKELDQSQSSLLEEMAYMKSRSEAGVMGVTVVGGEEEEEGVGVGDEEGGVEGGRRGVGGKEEEEEELKMAQVMLLKLELLKSILNRVDILLDTHLHPPPPPTTTPTSPTQPPLSISPFQPLNTTTPPTQPPNTTTPPTQPPITTTPPTQPPITTTPPTQPPNTTTPPTQPPNTTTPPTQPPNTTTPPTQPPNTTTPPTQPPNTTTPPTQPPNTTTPPTQPPNTTTPPTQPPNTTTPPTQPPITTTPPTQPPNTTTLPTQPPNTTTPPTQPPNTTTPPTQPPNTTTPPTQPPITTTPPTQPPNTTTPPTQPPNTTTPPTSSH